MEIVFEPLAGIPVARQRVEYVERKGIGHPDSMCDAMMEAVSVALSEAYLDRCGRILHHNIDKGLLVAGQTTPKFGGGVVDTPMRVVIGDRATSRVGDVRLPIEEIVRAAIRAWLRSNLRLVDPDAHVVLQNELRSGSAELTGIFDRQQLVANDTSAVVGYAPLSETDRIVLAAERFLNSAEFKQRHPETGEDVKIMGVRRDRRLRLTAAVALVDRFVADEAAYFATKHAIADELLEHVAAQTGQIDDVTVEINQLDREGIGQDGTYLTVLGTSAESGDGGQVGRGNRVNGLITFNRPMTLEAAAGKNPVSHVGKIYNMLAHQTAHAISDTLEEVQEVYVWMCSQIGQPLDQPWQVSAQLALADGVDLSDVESRVRAIILAQLHGLDAFTARLARGEWPIC